jgi:DNA polymerase V
MYALIDCNNFYASCERLFRPDLHNKPIVVLSNNDGCVIARSNEAKACGIAMGTPYFKIQALCKHYKIYVFSSNYVLYGDLSNRVMSIIEEAWTEMDQYSIDEAFLNLRSMPPERHDVFCRDLQKLILKSTGIPTSIGIAPTRTLAKLANHICKKELKIPVFNISQQRAWLSRINIGDVWGVGAQWKKKLNAQNIQTAADLAALSPSDVKLQFNMPLMHTGLELQGIPSGLINEGASRKSIIASRSFGEMHTELNDLAHAMSGHARNAYRKLRQQHALVKQITVFIQTNRFRHDLPQYNNQLTFPLIHPTDDLRLITRIAMRGLKKIYKAGFHYKKVGVCFDKLTISNDQQLDFFHQPTEEALHKKDCLMAIFDRINQKFGRDTLKLAAEGFDASCAMRSAMKSPHYTTQWSDLLIIKNST